MKKMFLCKNNYPESEIVKFDAGKYYWGEEKVDTIFMDWVNDGYGSLNINTREWMSSSGTHIFYKKPNFKTGTYLNDYFYTNQELRKLKLKKIEHDT